MKIPAKEKMIKISEESKIEIEKEKEKQRQRQKQNNKKSLKRTVQCIIEQMKITSRLGEREYVHTLGEKELTEILKEKFKEYNVTSVSENGVTKLIIKW